MLKFARYLVIGIALCLAVLVLNLGLTSSIYSDEIAYLKVNARIVTDAWHVSSLFPFCSASQNLPIPATLLPGALVAQFTLGSVADTQMLRIVGTVFFLLLGVCLVAIAWLSSRKNRAFSHAVLPAILPLLLGVFPFIGTLTRPEITISLCAALLLILFLLENRVKDSFPHNLGYFFLFSITSSWLLIQHPKSIFFVPYIAVIAWLIFQNRAKWVFAAVGVFVMTLSVQAYAIFQKKMFCPEIPPEAVSKFNNYLDPLQLFASPVSFLTDVFSNFGTFSHYIDSILFQQSPAVRWLPSIELFATDPMYANVNILILISYSIFFVMFFVTVAAHFYYFIRNPSQARSSAIVLALALPGIAVAGLQTTKNFYDSSFLLPLCSLVLAFGVGALESFSRPLKRLTTGVAFFLALVAIGSQILTLYAYSEESFSRHNGPSLPHQRFEQVYNATLFAKAVEACDLHAGPDTEHLVVDDLMYFKFKDTRHPIFMTYFLFQLSLKGRPDPKEFIPNLRKVGASGAIVTCGLIPEPIRMQMRAYDGFCCLRNSDINP